MSWKYKYHGMNDPPEKSGFNRDSYVVDSVINDNVREMMEKRNKAESVNCGNTGHERGSKRFSISKDVFQEMY